MARGMTGRATHVVARPFETNGRLLARGQAVDASSWRNADRLEDQRYLVPIASGDASSRGVAPGTGEGDE